MTLPLLISAPHAGTTVPEFLQDKFILSPADLQDDIDGGARDIYDIADHVNTFVTSEIARTVLDLNRAPDDFRPDGVVKTETAFQKQIWSEPLSEHEIGELLRRHHAPYHRRLSDAARLPGVLCGVDCHTMLAVGPPIGPGAGVKRPLICISNADGSCSDDTLAALKQALEMSFEVPVSVNDPFKGGYIIRA
ncbi:MAG TPA: N-formylglutamate amidohydrolase, partial [candidate division Zixibacteria bacterium]|nr:N-formylglutamate amidohydrolase [candidate division Zixibacteria bacterium]